LRVIYFTGNPNSYSRKQLPLEYMQTRAHWNPVNKYSYSYMSLLIFLNSIP